MTYTVVLFTSTDDDNWLNWTCPPLWWLNFCYSFDHTIEGTHDRMDQELKEKYNAVFRYGNTYHTGDRILDFDTEHDYLLFLLRWA